jgi:hypothetical protein
MLKPMSAADLSPMLEQLSQTLSTPIPPELDPNPLLGASEVVVDRREIERAAGFMAKHLNQHATSHELLTCTLVTIATSRCLRYRPNRGFAAERELNALAAATVAEAQARRGGIRFIQRLNLDELLSALVATHLTLEDRRQLVAGLLQQAEQYLRAPLRPLPSPDKPIIYVATPISDIDQPTHDEVMRLAERM